MTAPDTTARRDGAIIALIGLSHFNSHFFQLALPPLFPLLKLHFDVSYTALGAIMSLFYAASGLGQAAAGFVVDRVGGRRALMVGTTLLSGGIAAAALAPQFWMLYPLALLAGIGNSVYHPADYAILSHGVSKARLGRAYSVHGLGGSIGYAVSPVIVGALAQLLSWPIALAVCAAALGGVLVAVLARAGALLDAPAEAPSKVTGAAAPRADLASLLTSPAIVAGFLYFALGATVGIGLQNGGVPALMSLHDVPLSLAATVLTAFLVASACGMVLGGFIADRTTRHDTIALGGLLVAAGAMIAIATLPLTFAAVAVLIGFAGFALGSTYPARDMMVRASSPPGATGRTFGLVYSGLDIGSAVMPVVAGWLLDRGEPRVLFVFFAAALVLTSIAVLGVRPRRAAAAAAE
jgi:MFS family permease